MRDFLKDPTERLIHLLDRVKSLAKTHDFSRCAIRHRCGREVTVCYLLQLGYSLEKFELMYSLNYDYQICPRKNLHSCSMFLMKIFLCEILYSLFI